MIERKLIEVFNRSGININSVLAKIVVVEKVDTIIGLENYERDSFLIGRKDNTRTCLKVFHVG